ncbi:MAG: hypothetical protein KKH61_19765, partial [Gammaproteobacteria bacterium]|nr:hypothetical protein [Gammaproteobacteria bacterium]
HDKKHQEEAEAKHVETSASSEALPIMAEDTPSGGNPSPEAVAIHEGSLTVLAQMKDMEFHSRVNLERLSTLMLTVEDDLKQKDFAKSVGDLFSAQDTVQTQLTAFITAYQAECATV